MLTIPRRAVLYEHYLLILQRVATIAETYRKPSKIHSKLSNKYCNRQERKRRRQFFFVLLPWTCISTYKVSILVRDHEDHSTRFCFKPQKQAECMCSTIPQGANQAAEHRAVLGPAQAPSQVQVQLSIHAQFNLRHEAAYFQMLV